MPRARTSMEESLQRKQAASARKATAATARHRRQREAIEQPIVPELTPQVSIYQTSKHSPFTAAPQSIQHQPPPSPTRSRLPRNMLMELSNNSFLAQSNPQPWKKQTSQPWKRLANGLIPSDTTNTSASITVLQSDDVFRLPTSSQTSTTLSQIHRTFRISLPPPLSKHQPSDNTTLSQLQRRFGIRRQPAVTPFHMDVESPSPTTVRAAARTEARQRDNLLFTSPTRRRIPSPSPQPRRQLIVNMDGSTDWDDIDNVVDLQIPTEIPGVFPYERRVNHYDSLDETSSFTASRLCAIQPVSSFLADIRHVLPRCIHVCKHCTALHWANEASGSPRPRDPAAYEFTKCCSNGRLSFNPPQRPYPSVLRDLLTSTCRGRGGKIVRTGASRAFHQNIRHYNNSFAFTSMGCGGQNERLPGNGPPVFRIQGQLYHRIGSLLPPPDTVPAFLQVYIYDGIAAQETTRDRVYRNRDTQISRQIAELLHDVNPFVRFFTHNAERLREDNSIRVRIRLREPDAGDQRRYNLPIDESFAAIIPATEDGTTRRDIILSNRDGRFTRISELSPIYLPLRYPLLFPFGERGWHYQMLAAPGMVGRGAGGSTRVSPCEWFAGLFHSHKDVYSQVLSAGSLLHEIAVDGACVVESQKVSWLRANQKQLRADLYQGVVDYLAADANAEANNTIGRRVILPATYQGSPRNLSTHYQDAMAIARKHGGPSLFITFTCNPAWIEITRELDLGQTASDRPDLIARVYAMKLQELIGELTKKHIFGMVVAYCYVVEFQKRGLPHAHILLILSRNDQIITPDQVDSIMRAELPNPVTEPILYTIVASTMVHRKCGPHYRTAVCMQNAEGKCHARYPKAFCEETRFESGSFPLYRRRNDGRRLCRDGLEYDNRDIVPYSPYLSTRYNAHINVEVASNIDAFKYLYKYVYKGPDRIAAVIGGEVVDEIKEHIDARWLGTSESMWHLFGFPMAKHSPAVVSLQIHKENQQSVVWNEATANLEQVLESSRRTTLTEYFAMNKACQDDIDHGRAVGINSLEILYQDFPSAFVWNQKDKRWTVRKRETGTIGRVAFVSPRQPERFFLRLLIVTFAGFTSYEDVRTYQDTVYSTYREACLARGILANDHEWHDALSEAAGVDSGRALRGLFFYIIYNCNPSDPSELWRTHRDALSDDCKYRLTRPPYNIVNATDSQTLAPRQTEWYEDELIYDRQDLEDRLERDVPSLIADRREAYDVLTAAVTSGGQRGNVFFLDGPGGTGKTFVQNVVLSKVRADVKVALAVATTGIAATLLIGGRTAHTRFSIPIDLHAGSVCSVKKQSLHADLLRRTKLIFWDEAVMADKYVIDCVDRTLRDLTEVNRPFGGIITCFCGDFRQILPVVPGGSRAQIVARCIKHATCWEYVKLLRLTVNMRLQRPGLSEIEKATISAFSRRLLAVGEKTGRNDLIQWPRTDVVRGNSKDSLIESIFPDLANVTDEQLSRGAILAPRNNVVDDLNELILDRMPGPAVIRLSCDQPKDDDGKEHYSPEYLNYLRFPSLPHHRFRAKVGCPVILLRNLNPQAGLCNGTRLRVTKISSRTVKCLILAGPYAGNTELIPRIPLDSPDKVRNAVKFTRLQFPLRLAFAMTINKAQGQSLDRVGLLLDPPVFSHGQLYVALSRVTQPQGIHLKIAAEATEHGVLKNVVWEEVFRIGEQQATQYGTETDEDFREIRADHDEDGAPLL